MKIKFWTFFVLSFFVKFGFGQVYQAMPQYGYGPVKRFDVDSTLTIPTICGVPTLKSNLTRKSAIAFDTCNNRFYFYNSKTLVWDTIKGGGTQIDTTSLSNRINTKIDSLKRSTDSVFARINGTWKYQFKDSVGKSNGRFSNDTATIVMAKVHNDAGVQLTNGKVVAFSTSGTNSDVPSVRLANNKGDSTSANTFGFVTGTIAINDTGWIILSGKIEKLNTASYSNGDIIYLDSTNGNWTKTKPQATLHMVYLGVVIKSNAGNGSIFVKCQNGYELDEIHDVQINSKLNNQILVYSDTQKVWKNRNVYSVVDTTSLSARINLKQNAGSYLTPSDTTSLSNRINTKLNTSDSSIYFTKYRSDTMRSNIYSSINGKQASGNYITTSDTSVFQRKNIASYSFQANNTNAAANVTTQAFRDTSYTLSGSDITWTGTTAPGGTKEETIRWVQVGKMVTVYITLYYGTAGAANSAVTIVFPSALPTPYYPSAMGAANRMISTGNGTFSTNYAQPSAFYRGGLRRNSGNTGNEFFINFTSGSGAVNWAQLVVTYFTN